MSKKQLNPVVVSDHDICRALDLILEQRIASASFLAHWLVVSEDYAMAIMEILEEHGALSKFKLGRRRKYPIYLFDINIDALIELNNKMCPRIEHPDKESTT